ncbi:probable WRKY transcription factor 2 [Nymphaea colorata]|nr:probable WRKY transcription factor 2 [Nymphaea colorata]
MMAGGGETDGGGDPVGALGGGAGPTSPAASKPPTTPMNSSSSSSPRNLFSSFTTDGIGATSFLPSFSPGETDTGGAEAVQEGSGGGGGCEEKGGLSGDGGGDGQVVGGGGLSGRKSPDGGRSIAERRATSGFNAGRLNTARFRTLSPLSSPVVRSPYLTIPPGLSPTALLDSPVMLSNSLGQPSPTTGTFPGPPFMDQSPISVLTSDATKDELIEDFNASSLLAFKHQSDSRNTSADHLGNQVSSTSEIQQYVGMETVQSQTQFQMQLLVNASGDAECANKVTSSEALVIQETSTNSMEKANSVNLQSPPLSVCYEEASQPAGQRNVKDSGPQLLADGDPKDLFSPAGMGKPAEDGYNWRKYGQKQVKGSEYPRSYYKCTQPNCQVKKKVERSHDGQITEIIYKGTHNHPKPQPNRRCAIGSAFALDEMLERPENTSSLVNVEGSSLWGNLQQHGALKDKPSTDWRGDGPERTSSTSGVTDISDPSSTVQGKHLYHHESADTPELSSTIATDDECEDDEDDGATQVSISLADDADEIENESKRRKIESSAIEASLSSRAVREPRVVVQTTSEVDVLDDGYRWRKYGQKVVKGNPNPRSYYKCTNAGCSVRKHVERASHDLKSVITTYEGKHNHEVPAARNSNNGNTGSGNIGPSGLATQPSLALPTAATIAKPEPMFDDISPCFESNDYLRAASYLRSLTSDTKVRVSPGYDMKLPPSPAMPLTSFGMNAGHLEAHPLASFSQIGSTFPGPTPMSIQRSANPAAASGLLFNPGKVMGPMQPYLGQQHSEGRGIRIVRPKEEQKDDSYESRLVIGHIPNAPSLYNQMTGRFPL